MPPADKSSKRTIAQSFAVTRGKSIGLVPFIPAGYPDLQTTAEILKQLDAISPAAIEIGFPFSDPIADGPTIQQAFTDALTHKLKIADIFQTISRINPTMSSPMVAM